ncbi:MAG: hypothetical protein IJ558_08695 [Treponema sp.]|nr:hypothetical protein [Treponema sp.]
MKKSIVIGAFVAILSVFPSFAKDLSLEQTLAQAAAKISDSIDGKVKTVAVLDIRSEYWALSDYIVSLLNDEFANTFTQTNVAERDEYSLALIQQESDYQLSGAVSDETIQEIGAALGADCIVLGNMESVSGGWQLILRASTVETKKVLVSWRGKVSSKEKEVKFQIEKSKKSARPKIEVQKPASPLASVSSSNNTNAASNSNSSANVLTVTASMINERGEDVSVLHPGDVIRFRVSASQTAYLAILCTDARGEEEWLPLQNSRIIVGESRIFPDLPGAKLRVQDGVFGGESVTIFASVVKDDLPNQANVMEVQYRTLGLEFGAEGNHGTAETVIRYRVER